MNFLLPHPNFKGLWKDVIILVFLLYCPFFFFFCSSLRSQRIHLLFKHRKMEDEQQKEAGYVKDCLLKKEKKNKLSFGKDKLKRKVWEILSSGCYLVFSCMYFPFYTNEMHVRSSRRLMFTWVLVLFCHAVRIYIFDALTLKCTFAAQNNFLRYSFVKSVVRADGKSNVSFAIYEQMYFISFLWTL